MNHQKFVNFVKIEYIPLSKIRIIWYLRVTVQS